MCVGCNACIRTCPVPTANRCENGIVYVNDDQCIRCGECVRGCTHGAREYEDDTERFFDEVKRGRVSLIVAPAIKTVFDGNWRHVLQWLKSIGVKEVYDTSFGADICTYLHIQYVKKNPNAKVISQPCAAIVNYVEKHKPELIEHMSPIQSPMMCTAIYVRKYMGVSDTLVGFSPCVAKGDEFHNTGVIKYNITYKKIKEYIEKHHISLPTGHSDFEFSGLRGFDGGYYPLPGGLKDCLRVYAPDLNVTTSEGVHKVYDDFDKYLNAPMQDRPTVYDVLSCEYGCNYGVGGAERFDSFSAYGIMTNVKEWSFNQSRRKRFPMRILKSLKLEDFCRGYVNRKTEKDPTKDEIQGVFRRMGKCDRVSQTLDCHACGYKSCKDMATAIHFGNNVESNCIHYERARIAALQEEAHLEHVRLAEAVKEVRVAVGQLADKVMPIAERTAEHQQKNTVISSDMLNLENQVSGMSTAVNDVVGAVEDIRSDVDAYTHILATIKSIADQTHILAINASIEAARAGEQGRSFAVVATDVRELALKSNQTVETAKTYTDKMVASLKRVDEVVNSIESVVATTHTSTEGTLTAIKEIEEGSTTISSNLQEVSAVIEELYSMLHVLDKTDDSDTAPVVSSIVDDEDKY